MEVLRELLDESTYLHPLDLLRAVHGCFCCAFYLYTLFKSLRRGTYSQQCSLGELYGSIGPTEMESVSLLCGRLSSMQISPRRYAPPLQKIRTPQDELIFFYLPSFSFNSIIDKFQLVECEVIKFL